MGNAQIRFATGILRRLGEELNPSPDQGILELVKNAYDADARNCRIELRSTDRPGGSVLITDDGDGMNTDGIRNGWLILGESDKSVNKPTRLGRIPAGNKGLGRLAALRMGTNATLITRPRSNKTKQYSLHIDWSDYENVKTVDEVDLTIEECPREPNLGNGAEIFLENLRSPINRMDVKRLARALILLADPFADNPEGFNPHLVAPEFSDLEALVQKRYFDDAEYHLSAEVNEQGCAHAIVTDWKGKELFSADHEELTKSRGGKPYNCPPAEFDLWVFIMSSANFSTRRSTLGEVRAWLKEFGGVHLYENGLRVSPYGNPGNDWLDMNLRRAQFAQEFPATTTSIGRVSVSNTKELLVQKTDRSGFIENEVFLELRDFAQDAMDWMGRRRLDSAMKRRKKEQVEASKKSSKSKKRLEEAISGAPKEAQVELRQAFKFYDRSRDKEVNELRKEVQLYRTLSTAGITTATFAHESSGNPIKVITQSVKAIERRAKKALDGRYKDILEAPVNSIIRSIDSLAVLGNATLKLLVHEKRRVGRVEIHEVIEEVLTTFKPFLDGRDVTVTPELCPGNPYLRGSKAAVESIITNLINNSLTAFEHAGTLERKILIRTTLVGDELVLSVLDNGPGIQGISVKDIWLPGQTTRPNGTGLGLTIVRDAVEDLNGTVDAIAKSELGGTSIIIEVPILGA